MDIFLEFANKCTFHFSHENIAPVASFPLHISLIQICAQISICTSFHTKASTHRFSTLDLLPVQQHIDRLTLLGEKKPQFQAYDTEHLFPVYFHMFLATKHRHLCIVQVSKSSLDLSSQQSSLIKNIPSDLSPYTSMLPSAAHFTLISATNSQNTLFPYLRLPPLLRSVLLIVLFRGKAINFLTTCAPCRNDLFEIVRNPRQTFLHFQYIPITIIPPTATTSINALIDFWENLHYKVNAGSASHQHRSCYSNTGKLILCTATDLAKLHHNCTNSACQEFAFKIFDYYQVIYYMPSIATGLIHNMTYELNPAWLYQVQYRYTLAVLPSQDSPIVHVLAMLKPIPLYGWAVVASVVVALVIILKISGKAKNQGFWALSIILEQGDVQGNFRNLKMGALIVLWTYTGMMLRNCYTSTMFSHIAVKARPDPPASIDEIRAKNMSYMEYFHGFYNTFVLDTNKFLPTGVSEKDVWPSNMNGITDHQRHTTFQCRAFSKETARQFFRNLSTNQNMYCVPAYRDWDNADRIPAKLGKPKGFVMIYGKPESITWLKLMLRNVGRMEVIENKKQLPMNYGWTYWVGLPRHFFSKSWQKTMEVIHESGLTIPGDRLSAILKSLDWMKQYRQQYQEIPEGLANYYGLLFESSRRVGFERDLEKVDMKSVRFVLLLYALCISCILFYSVVDTINHALVEINQ